jgi:putative endonuclease
MSYYVYILKSFNNKYKKTYVGYTNNLKKRINKHNNNKGAKSTKGYKWKLIYKKIFKTKSLAMSYEYKIKKKRSLRKKLIEKKIK